MFTRNRIATLAVMIAAAIVPSVAAQAADARPAPVGLELCNVKWVLGPHQAHTSAADSVPSVEDFDVENQTASGEPDPFDYETVEHDDLSYDGC